MGKKLFRCKMVAQPPSLYSLNTAAPQGMISGNKQCLELDSNMKNTQTMKIMDLGASKKINYSNGTDQLQFGLALQQGGKNLKLGIKVTAEWKKRIRDYHRIVQTKKT